ncbi:innexin unc-9-like isoform X2 [Physella acuta]|uniref:innexin unc-9-like isoform X2 n=1 Tax=Physella acuta TaxID=109671 RepID=UPI0027DCEAEF|nr:innexin unc-9-like isoform X2 [Physella acuta]
MSYAATILGSWASYNKLVSSNDDDWVDRLNHLYTVILLAIFAVFVTGGQYAGNPIECWVPAHFTGSYRSYAKSYCWVKNTYHVPMDTPIPSVKGERSQEELTYYQWVPVILLFMALLFKFPALVWRGLNGLSGLSIDKIVTMTTSTQYGDEAKREETLEHISTFLDRWLDTRVKRCLRRNLISRLCACCADRGGKILTTIYLLVKFLFLLNVIIQFFLLNAFMGDWYHVYGFEVLEGLSSDENWTDSARFPKVTMCDFEIRQLANIQTYTVQCVLPINLFNEKIFIFLWFWFVFVAVCTSGNFLFWIWRALVKNSQAAYIKKYLSILDQVRTTEDKKLARRFAEEYLRDDGVFILRLIARNTSDILIGDLILKMFNRFKDKPAIKASRTNDDEDHL